MSKARKSNKAIISRIKEVINSIPKPLPWHEKYPIEKYVIGNITIHDSGYSCEITEVTPHDAPDNIDFYIGDMTLDCDIKSIQFYKTPGNIRAFSYMTTKKFTIYDEFDGKKVTDTCVGGIYILENVAEFNFNTMKVTEFVGGRVSDIEFEERMHFKNSMYYSDVEIIVELL